MGVVVLLGAPGSGKGTTAAALARIPGIVHLSTGEILREAMRSETPRGLEIRPYMDAGQLVPDELVTGIVEESMESGDPGATYILDGFPRNLKQAKMLDDYLRRTGGRLRVVFLLEADEEALVQRLLGRLTCPSCRAIYHLDRIPPKQEGVCDRCGASLQQRRDDVKATIRERMDVYRRETEPLVAWYREQGLLKCVSANGVVSETVAAIDKGLDVTP